MADDTGATAVPTEKALFDALMGEPLAGVSPYGVDNLPVILDYQGTSDVPSVFNALSGATQTALDKRLAKTEPSSPPATSGYRRIVVSATAPSSPQTGDVWFQV